MPLVETLSRRPVVGDAAAFVLGTAGGLQAGGVPARAFAAAGLAAAAGLVARRLCPRGAARLLARHGALLLLAWGLAAAARAELERQRGTLLAAGAGRPVVLRGTIAAKGAARPASRGEWRHSFTMRGIVLADGDGEHPLPRLAVHVTWYGPGGAGAPPQAVPRPGERWEMRGRVERARKPELSHLLFFVSRTRASRRLEGPATPGWRERCESCRRRAAGRLAAGIEDHPADVALIHAILLGYRGDIPPALNRVFRESGTLHVFAISGMHVMVIAWMLTTVVARLGVPRHLWIVVLAPALALYVWSTGCQPSALRAGIMALLYLAAPLLGRRPDAPAALAVAALLLLAADPLQLHDVGFILSFTVVLGLILLASPLVRLLRRVCGLENMAGYVEAACRLGGELPAAERRRLLLRRRLLGAGHYLTELAGVSLAAWLTSTPLTARFFGLFTPASLPANLVVVPFSFVVMTAAGLGLATASLAPPLGVLCNRAARLGTAVMRTAAQVAARLPGGVWQVPRPSPWGVLLWYVALAWLAWRMAPPARRDRPADSSWLEEAQRERRERREGGTRPPD
jgi:ComEC/Rec2-related protein